MDSSIRRNTSSISKSAGISSSLNDVARSIEIESSSSTTLAKPFDRIRSTVPYTMDKETWLKAPFEQKIMAQVCALLVIRILL